jgi:hypothetical protein
MLNNTHKKKKFFDLLRDNRIKNLLGKNPVKDSVKDDLILGKSKKEIENSFELLKSKFDD